MNKRLLKAHSELLERLYYHTNCYNKGEMSFTVYNAIVEDLTVEFRGYASCLYDLYLIDIDIYTKVLKEGRYIRHMAYNI